MRSSSRSARLLAILAAVALLVASCDEEGGEADTGEVRAEGPSGSVRFLIAENFWADWEPYQSTAQSQARLEEQIYDYLVQFPTGDLSAPEPMLATSWEQVDDTTWEFELQEGVTFHEGQDFTSADVKASIELASGATKTETVTSQNWVPTTVEAGYANSAYNFWLGALVAAKTPREIVERLHREINTLVQSPEIGDRIRKLGADPLSMSIAEFDAMIQRELADNARLIKAAGIKAN